MPFIGKTPETGAFRLIDSITTSATDTYALTVQGDHYFPESARNLIVSLNGVTQAPESAYTVSGSHIVFASALTASDVIDYILVIGDSVDIGTPSDGTVGNAQLKASLDLSGKTLTLANDQISGDVIHGGTISNFASTGLDDNATSTAITIDADGDVGVGIATPFFQASNRTAVSINGTSASNLVFGVGGSANTYLLADAAGFTIGNTSATLPTMFYTNSAERMRIDSSGRVGIGTTSPARLLTLSGSGGTLLSLVSTNDDNCQVLFGDSASDTVGKVVYAHDTNHMRFETNSAERMRIDSAGRLLIGKTSTTFRDDGCVFGASNADVNGWSAWIAATPGSGGGVLAMNRDGSDGEQIRFHKNGAGFASIGNNNGDEPYFARSVGTTSGIKIANGALTACQSNGTDHDAAQNLGSSTIRWGNLFLSGGAYLGGTGSANYLDDYEEGTFTAYLGFSGGDSGGLNYTNQTFVYTKVGRMVSFSGFLTWNQNNFTSASGRMYLRGLPFVIINGGSYRGGAGIHYSNSPWTNITVYQQEFRSEDGTTDMTFNFADATDGSIDSEITTYTRIALSGNFMVSGTYMTN